MTYQTSPISKESGADFSAAASRYLAVVLNTDQKAVLPSAGGAILGVLDSTPALGDTALILMPGSGEIPLRLGGTVAADDKLKVAADGQFVVAAAGDIAAGSAVAYCTKGGADGEVGSGVLFGGAGTRVSTTASETKTTGDLSVNVDESLLNHGGAVTGILADGLYVGQKKRFRCIGAVSTYTITPTTMLAGQPTVFVVTAAGPK